MEKRYITRSGGRIWAHLSVSLVRDEHGRPRHFISQLQDITERKRSERMLRAADAEARAQRDYANTIISAMHEGYALTVDGEIKAVNEALCHAGWASASRNCSACGRRFRSFRRSGEPRTWSCVAGSSTVVAAPSR